MKQKRLPRRSFGSCFWVARSLLAVLAGFVWSGACAHASEAMLSAVQASDLALVRRLLAAEPASAYTPNRYGVTPLALACTNGDSALVDALLVAGADANRALLGGETPLMTAARTGRVSVVTSLLAHGAVLDAKLSGGQTALMWAAAEGHTAVVVALIGAKADVMATVPTGLNALLFAIRAGHVETVRVLLKTGLDINAVTAPTKTGNKLPKRGNSALTLAVENGRFEVASLLLDLGADPNDLRSGYAPLHILAWIRKPDIGEDEGDPSLRTTPTSPASNSSASSSRMAPM
jgi:ankyrin repeat protein